MTNVSVALATFNGARFIDEQLRSLAAQTHLPSELVVVDDGSSDDTLAKVSSFAASSPFPVHIHRNSERLGYRLNFMKAAALCTSELISFCDQDDVWMDQKISRSIELFANADVLLVFHNAVVTDGFGKHVGKLFGEASFPLVSSLTEGSAWLYPRGFSQTFRSSLLSLSKYHELSFDTTEPGELMSHDRWISFIGFSLGSTGYVDDTLVLYRQHDANLFGVGEVRSEDVFSLLHLRIEDRSQVFVRLCRASASCGSILKEIADDESVDMRWRTQARQTRDRWFQLADLYRLRAKAYQDRSIQQRLASVSGLRQRGAYGRDADWSFGWKSLLRDIVFGGLLGRLVTRLGAPQSDTDWSLRGRSTRTP